MYLSTILSVLFIFARTIFSSRIPPKLASLAKMELGIYNVLDTHSSRLKMSIPLLNEYLEDFQNSSLKILNKIGTRHHEEFGFSIADNPILSYRMIRRYENFLRPIYRELEKQKNKELEKGHYQDVLSDIRGGKSAAEILPKWSCILDLQEAMEAILRLHHIYELDLKEFTTGNIMGVETQVGLTRKQCYEIGEYALQLKQYTYAILWLEIALNETKGLESLNLTDNILKTLKLASQKHDNDWDNKTSRDFFFFQNKLSETTKSEKKRITLRNVEFQRNKGKKHNVFFGDATFWGLCSGENYQSIEEISDLYCWYERTNPALRIAPLKIEKLSKSLHLIRIYDIISESEMKDMKLESLPALKRSQVVRTNFVPVYQGSPVSYLADSPLTRKISRRIESVTGLVARYPNGSQRNFVKCIAFGGHDSVHLDYLEVMEGNRGNRIATMLFYLEDVEIGGYTAFQTIGVALKPIKGSAIFWYNMLRSGEPDFRSEHAGCPPVLGHKWIAVQSILSHAQIWTRPCGLSPHE